MDDEVPGTSADGGGEGRTDHAGSDRTAGTGSGAGPKGDNDTTGSRARQPRTSPPAQAPTGESEFDWRGWLLVGVVVVAFVVAPVSILALPAAQSLIASLGLTLRDAYLVVPLVPAFLLGAVAVWAAVRSRA
jgi:hypothetical protein